MDREYKTCQVVIGKDTRRSSYTFEYTLAARPIASSADAHLFYVTTTPSVLYVARMEGFDCSVMISASHNPYYDNGIKLVNTQGEKMDEDAVLQVEVYLDGISGEISPAVRERIGRTMDHTAGQNRCAGYLTSPATHSYENTEVGLDCANRSAWMIARNMFDALEASTYVTNSEPDGLNINTDCGSAHMGGLVRFVREKRLDVGFAFDGGVDRCPYVDERGNLVNGDSILCIYGRCMKERRKLAGDKIVTAVMSNFGLYKALDEAGIEHEKIAVGDRHVYENMALNGYRIGDEQSDYIIFRKYATTGGGILTAIKIMEVIPEKKQPLSKLAGPAHIYPQVLENTHVKDKQVAREDRDVQDAVNRVEQELGTEGCVLVRESGTEPVMRVVVEARDGHKCREYMDRIIRVMVDKDHQDVLS